MQQFAWFVDAGYLYAEGGQLCLSVRHRGQIEIDFGEITRLLAGLGAEAEPSERHLRTYWYDGAPGGTPSPAQHAVAHQPGVKVRLGSTVARGEGFVQKGVDSLIVRDLIRLSQNRAISTAYLLGGDEDLRQGVVEAQDMGVRVVLVGIGPFGEQSVAATLMREADDVIVLDRERLAPSFRLREYEEAPADASRRAAYDVGVDFGQAWASDASAGAVDALRASGRLPGSYRVPPEIDRELLRHANAHLGYGISEQEKIDLRQGFRYGALGDDDAPPRD